MSERFTKKQRALLDACAEDFTGMTDGVPVLTIMGTHEHSLATAKSLEKRGWLTIELEEIEAFAYFDGTQYGEYMEMFAQADPVTDLFDAEVAA